MGMSKENFKKLRFYPVIRSCLCVSSSLSVCISQRAIMVVFSLSLLHCVCVCVCVCVCFVLFLRGNETATGKLHA